MKRRDVIKLTSLAFGFAASGTAVTALLSGCNVEPQEDFQAGFFSARQTKTLSRLADIIFPKTDSPAASEVGVIEFIDGLYNEAENAESKDIFAKGMDAFYAAAKETLGKDFNEADPAAQTDFVKKIDAAAFNDGLGTEEEDEEKRTALSRFWRKFKSNVTFAYFSSEQVAKEVLVYAPPSGVGPFEGCTDLQATTGGKAWAVT